MTFFISFSTRNRPVVREIMAGLRSRNIAFWDYSDEEWSIDMTAMILSRLKEEIDRCDYFVAVVSKESLDPDIGHFTRLEVAYALQEKKLHLENRVLTIELEGIKSSDYAGPYLPLKDFMHYELIWNEDKGKSILSFIGLMKRICRSVGVDYLPRISPHHRMPFWERFREEIRGFDHRMVSHIELMGNLGEFNEFFKLKLFPEALKSISHFIFTCEYTLPEYRLLYPWIVKGVTEQFLGKHREAIESFRKALETETDNPDALAGLGQAFRITGDYPSSVSCYEKAWQAANGIRKVNMMLNIIFSKVSGNVLPAPEERSFIMGLDVEQTVAADIAELEQRGLLSDFSDDPQEAVRDREKVISERSAEERSLILAAKALTCYCEAVTLYRVLPADRYRELLLKAYHIFKTEFPENAISNTGMVYYYYLTARYLNLSGEAERILSDAIARSEEDNALNRRELIQFLAEHHLVTGAYSRSAGLYEKELSGHFSDLRVAVYYALALYKSGNPKYREVCRKVLETLPSGYPGYYWSGFAHYLLGEVTYAQHDYGRSNQFGEYYERLV